MRLRIKNIPDIEEGADCFRAIVYQLRSIERMTILEILGMKFEALDG